MSDRTAHWLRIVRARLDVDQAALAKMIGVSRSTIANYESGSTIPPDTLAKLRRLMPDEPLNEREESVRLTRPSKQPVRKLKIYGSISAGDGNVSAFDADEYYIPVDLARDDYGGLVIDGDSMEPLLHAGDLAIFRDWKHPKLHSVMAAQLPDSTWVCKQLVYRDGQIVLHSLNETYKDISGPYTVSGFLVGYIRDLGPERIIRINPYGIKVD